MDSFVIAGRRPLHGSVRVNGAKNAALPMMAAALLLDEGERLVLHNVPDLSDIRTMVRLLEALGCRIERRGTTLHMTLADRRPTRAPYDIVSTMRASICVLGPLVARRGEAQVSLPGGCAIGVRPVDLHTKALSLMGASITIDHGYIVARAKQLRGTMIFLGGEFGSTVTGTANVMMAASLARGQTVIEYAAEEPEVQELAKLLIRMGAQIEGIGSHRLTINGVGRLQSAEYTVIPDRIEAGTFMAAAAATQGDVVIENVREEHMYAVLETLRAMGVHVSFPNSFTCRVAGPKRLKAADLTTLPYPGFPTDLQSQFMALLTTAVGMSVVNEKIYPDRFLHVAELGRMGAQVRKQDAAAFIAGVPGLRGAPVMASDLRAGAGLVIAALGAEGFTTISRIYHVDRGYEKIEQRLNLLGAKVTRVAEASGEKKRRKAE